jgi:hypothetical protein
MADLHAHPTLPELQRYMDEICKERGWTKDNYAEKFLLFTEEVGELNASSEKLRNSYSRLSLSIRLQVCSSTAIPQVQHGSI